MYSYYIYLSIEPPNGPPSSAVPILALPNAESDCNDDAQYSKDDDEDVLAVESISVSRRGCRCWN